MRALSNIINNSIEAFNLSGIVTVALQVYREKIAITIADNGKGIPADVLPRLLSKGATFGKENGNGLGLYHAKTIVEAWSGKFDLQSREGMGTIVTLQLQKAVLPQWIVTELQLGSSKKVVVLDDDLSIGEIWRHRFADKGVVIEGYTVSSDLQDAMKMDSESFSDAIYLIDFQLGAQAETGIDIAKSLGIIERTIIVTSEPERALLQNGQVRVLPKSAVAVVAIV